MLKQVKCVHDADLDGGFPARRPGRVSVRLRDGRTVTKQVDFPKGDPRNPLTDDDLAAIFRHLSAKALSAAQQDRAIATALALRRHGAQALMDACRPGA
jgi:2-methylcitrate dehydratase